MIEISADRWPDHIRLSDIETGFVNTPCGKRGAEVGPSFPSARWDRLRRLSPTDPACSYRPDVCPFFIFDPAIEAAGAIVATFEPHQVGVLEQVRTDLALFEVGQEDAVDAARKFSAPS